MPSNPPPENSPSEPESRPPLTSDELLPPVEPPSASFIIQLFVVPAIIVLLVVLAGMVITSLANRNEADPETIVSALRSSNQQRWQTAKQLADMLRMESRYPELKTDRQLAAQLAELLREETEAGRMDDNSVELRYFLARVLGAFAIDEGLDELLTVARTDPDRDVRLSAISALAELAHTFNTKQPPENLEHEALVETLFQLANEQDDLIRSQTAFTIGVFAGQPDADPRLMQELEVLADDLYSDTRYNAALALARYGNLKALEAVKEMFDPQALRMAVAEEEDPALQTYKRNTILKNAIDAADMLWQKNSEAELPELRETLQDFIERAPTWEVAGKVPEVLVERAELVLEKHAPAER